MKKEFTEPVVEITVLDSEDIIITSGCGGAGCGMETPEDEP